MAYIARTDIEKYLNITLAANGQALVDSLLPVVDALVDKYTNRTWTKGANDNIVEYFDGGTDTFYPKIVPVASVQSVEIDGQAYDAAGIYTYEQYVVLSSKVSATPPRAVKITYRTSANAIPADVKQALIQWVAEMYKSSPDAGKVTQNVTLGPHSVSFLVKDGIPAFVKLVLDLYRVIDL